MCREREHLHLNIPYHQRLIPLVPPHQFCRKHLTEHTNPHRENVGIMCEVSPHHTTPENLSVLLLHLTSNLFEYHLLVFPRVVRVNTLHRETQVLLFFHPPLIYHLYLYQTLQQFLPLVKVRVSLLPYQFVEEAHRHYPGEVHRQNLGEVRPYYW